jgi:hypothetical protein
MAPVHTATPDEIGGSADADEVLVFHTQGPLMGMTLLNKANDPTLAPALAAHEIVVAGKMSAAGPAKPTNTAPPTITGSPETGATLTANEGTWTGTPTFTYKWIANAVPIGGATAKTLVLDSGHQGANITVEVTGTNAGGSTAVTSAAVGPITDSGGGGGAT